MAPTDGRWVRVEGRREHLDACSRWMDQTPLQYFDGARGVPVAYKSFSATTTKTATRATVVLLTGYNETLGAWALLLRYSCIVCDAGDRRTATPPMLLTRPTRLDDGHCSASSLFPPRQASTRRWCVSWWRSGV